MTNKIYCEDCRYCMKPNFFAIEVCDHLLEQVVVETHMRSFLESKTLAKDKNKNRDCNDYDRIWWGARLKKSILRALYLA